MSFFGKITINLAPLNSIPCFIMESQQRFYQEGNGEVYKAKNKTKYVDVQVRI